MPGGCVKHRNAGTNKRQNSTPPHRRKLGEAECCRKRDPLAAQTQASRSAAKECEERRQPQDNFQQETHVRFLSFCRSLTS